MDPILVVSCMRRAARLAASAGMACALATASAVAAGAQAVRSTGEGTAVCRSDAIAGLLFGDNQNRILVIAHRGAHAAAPENSLAAIQAAVAMGAAAVEIDIRRTADGVPVLMHDDTLDRTTDARGAVRETTAGNLTFVRLRGPDGVLTDEPPPTLADALDAARGRIWLMLDSKVDALEDVSAIAELVKERGMEDQVIVYDYAPDALERYRSALPAAAAMIRTKDAAQIEDYVATYSPDIFHIDPSYNTPETAARFDAWGIPTFLALLGDIDAAFARGDSAALNTQLNVRPDMIQTDLPGEVIAILRRDGRHPAALDQAEWTGCAK